MLQVHEQGLGVTVKLPLLRRYKAKERRRLLRSVGNYKLHTYNGQSRVSYTILISYWL
jgi:hypothetical protein